MDSLDAGNNPSMSSKELRDYTKNFLRNMKLANGDDPDIDLRKAKNAQKKQPAPKQYYIGAAKPEPTVAEAAITGVTGSKHVYYACIHFEQGCEMEEVRAFGVINNLKDKVDEVHHLPDKILEDDNAAEIIRNEGFRIWFTTDMENSEAKHELDQTIFMEKLDFQELDSTAECEYWPSAMAVAVQAAESSEPIKPPMPEVFRPEIAEAPKPARKQPSGGGTESQMITVRVDKLDKLMDLVGELVIAEAMVTQNPDIAGLELDNFQKAARQLHKINGELQDSVMALRMVPLEGTFKKMNRIVRDMTKKLGKKARLVLEGEYTEVDKNINEHISDPLMHIVRNSVDHGIEMPDVRVANGKPEIGTVVLSAENAGGEVVLKIQDDGGGLNKEKILDRARKNGILTKPEEELTDQEIYSFIFAPGFSTKEKVTEFSGRGVGMDVVVSNIKSLGGPVTVESVYGQ